MPAQGTKRIEIDGRDVYIDEADVQLDKIICAGVLAQEKFDEAKLELDSWKAELLKIAEARRSGRSSITLVAPTGRGAATIVWANETRVDEDEVESVRKEIPEKSFRELFDERVTFRLRRGWQNFMKLPQPGVTADAKARLAAAISIKPRSPSVKFAADGTAATAGDEEQS